MKILKYYKTFESELKITDEIEGEPNIPDKKIHVEEEGIEDEKIEGEGDDEEIDSGGDIPDEPGRYVKDGNSWKKTN